MCGFVGFTGNHEKRKEILQNAMDRIVHRGPDMSGEYYDNNISLGFRRLSIIDLSTAGKQPMTSEDGDYTLVFNGEIYNFPSLREQLHAIGYEFKTSSDSEVLLTAYREWGEKTVYHLRGMFAFVIYDKKKSQLYGARDFFGIKPFYYATLSTGDFIFGSEIKSFLEHPDFKKSVNKKALKPYLTFQYSSMEETFFEGVYKLPQAHYFIYKDGKMKTERFWDIDFRNGGMSFDSAVEMLDSTVRESVRAHKISDVKIGAFLSGGVDSSYITAAMMPDKTFSVGFEYEDVFNETDDAKELSRILGIENYKKIITADECFDAFPAIQYHMDEPQSNPSSVPLYFLTKLAAEQVTVVLSGEGADEIFAGYEWYHDSPRIKNYKNKVPLGIRKLIASGAKKMPYFKGHDMLIEAGSLPEDYFIGQAKIFSEAESDSILSADYKNAPSVREITAGIYKNVAGKDDLIKKQYLDLNLWMPGDILLKADKMSMAHSLELRVPFLDKEVMAFAETIPSEYKIMNGETKYVLRKAADRTIPNEWAMRPKNGFPVPIKFWLREKKYYEIVKSYFEADYAGEFFDVPKILSILNDHYNGKSNNQRKIWTLFTFLTWYKDFFVDNVNNI